MTNFAALPTQDYADLVFHVLAHVETTAPLPSSLYDARYVEFAEQHLGPAKERQLGQDRQVLGTLLTTHEALASVQRLAWLHDGTEEAARAEAKLLSELTPSDVASSVVLGALKGDRAEIVEVLRCAVALERPHYEALPPVHIDRAAQAELLQRLGELSHAAPLLTRARIVFVRALGGRGRVFGNEIWIGVPGESYGPSAEHAAWQAAHEATVSEVTSAAQAQGLGLGERQIELASLVTLNRRAGRFGLAEAHQRWLTSVTTRGSVQGLLEQAQAELGSALTGLE